MKVRFFKTCGKSVAVIALLAMASACDGSGGADCTAVAKKLAEEYHLEFRGGFGRVCENESLCKSCSFLDANYREKMSAGICEASGTTKAESDCILKSTDWVAAQLCLNSSPVVTKDPDCLAACDKLIADCHNSCVKVTSDDSCLNCRKACEDGWYSCKRTCG